MESDNHVVFWKEYNVTFPASSPDDAREQDCAGELRGEVRLSHHIRRKNKTKCSTQTQRQNAEKKGRKEKKNKKEPPSKKKILVKITYSERLVSLKKISTMSNASLTYSTRGAEEGTPL